MTKLSSEKPELFKGRHFNHLLIIQAVRLYVTYKLSYRDVCDLFLLSKNRDRAATVRFFKKAVGNHAVTEKITLDGSQSGSGANKISSTTYNSLDGYFLHYILYSQKIFALEPYTALRRMRAIEEARGVTTYSGDRADGVGRGQRAAERGLPMPDRQAG